MALRCLKILKNLFFVFLGLFSTVLFGLFMFSNGGADTLKNMSPLKDLWVEQGKKTQYVDSLDEEDPFVMDMHVHMSKAEMTQKVRLDGVANGCLGHRKSLSELGEKQIYNLLRHIIVNDKYKFLYCVIPKVACSNWKRTIMALEDRVDDPNSVGKVMHRNFTYLSDLPEEKILYSLKNYYKFMFVRPPLERLVSAYRNKFTEKNLTAFPRMYGRKIVRKYRKNAGKNPNGDDVTFTEFVSFVVDTEPELMNEHWMPYVDLCQPCSITYDFIGKMETLDEDVNQVLKNVGAQDAAFPQRQKYYNPTTNHVIYQYIRQLPLRLKRRLLKKYRADFSLFQYTPS